MKERGGIGRLGGYAEEVAAAMRRRKETRKPRVRVRVGHGEATLVDADVEPGAGLLQAAQELVDETGRSTGRA
jgi:hypothetical protein